jgi:hypothetical protein
VDYNKINILIDNKSIVIILLSLLVVGLIFFNHSNKDIENYGKEIDNLNNSKQRITYLSMIV